jgi:hypothetical protein
MKTAKVGKSEEGRILGAPNVETYHSRLKSDGVKRGDRANEPTAWPTSPLRRPSSRRAEVAPSAASHLAKLDYKQGIHQLQQGKHIPIGDRLRNNSLLPSDPAP